MTTAFSALLAVVLMASVCAYADTPPPKDRIDRLRDKLAATPMWQNGSFPILALPSAPTEAEIVAEAVWMNRLDEGRITKYEVITSRDVSIPTPGLGASTPSSLKVDLRAVELSTNLGAMVLLYDQKQAGGVWTRIYKQE